MNRTGTRWRHVWPEARAQKFRQAAFVYLHVAILYEAAAWVVWRADMLPTHRGPPWLYLLLGPALAALIFWFLYSLQNKWAARIVWGVHALRLPAMIGSAFVVGKETMLAPAAYLTAIVVIVINLWMLARAGWDV